MSIYSGFPTRQDETNYNKLLCRLIMTFQQHIIELSGGVIAAHFSSKYSKIVARLQSYQQHKYLPPKFSTLLKPLQDTMRNSIVRYNKNDTSDFHMRLQSVKQQDQIPSYRQANRHKKQLHMKKSGVINQKIIQKEQFASGGSIKIKDNKQRSFSVVSDKKNKPQTEMKRTQKLRQSLQDFNKKRYTQTSSGQRLKIKKRNVLSQHSQKSLQISRGVNLMKALSDAVQKRKN